MDKIKLIEAIVTWQGEGPDSGKRMLLVRFKRCQLGCKKCDTQVKMECSIEAEYSIEEFKKVIKKEKLGLLITGGEPTFGKQLDDTINLIKSLKGIKIINVETNGCDLIGLYEETKYFPNIKYIYSPKFNNEKDVYEAIRIVEHLNDKNQYRNLYIKLVYFEESIEFNNMFLQRLNNDFPDMNDNIYLMPEGKTREELLINSPYIFDQCEEFKVNFTSRDHVIYNFI